MYSPKDFICGFVSAAAFPPPFDNSCVVAEYLDMLLMWFAYKAANRSDEELESDCFSPADFTTICFPAWKKTPCSPPVTNDDADADARAGIRVGPEVTDTDWARYVFEDVGFLESSGPPLKVLCSAMRWGTWNERTVIGYTEHGFQRGEIRSSFSDDQAGMKQFSIEALDLCEGVCLPLKPFPNAGQVFLLFGVRNGHRLFVKIPGKSQVWYHSAERNCLGDFPWNAQMVRNTINITIIICILGGGREVLERYTVVFVEFFKTAIFPCLSTEPYPAAVLTTASGDENILVPLFSHSIVLSEVLFLNSKEDVIIHPF